MPTAGRMFARFRSCGGAFPFPFFALVPAPWDPRFVDPEDFRWRGYP